MLNSYDIAVLKDLVLADIKRLQELPSTPANALTLEKREFLRDKLWGMFTDPDRIDDHEELRRMATHVFQGLAASSLMSGMSVDDVADLAYDGAIALLKRLNRP